MKRVIVILIILSLIFISFFVFKKEEETKGNKNISVILETKEGNIKSNTFPSKDEYMYKETICNNTEDNVNINFNNETWKLDLNVEEDSIDGDFFCNIYFKEQEEYNFDYTGDYQIFTVPYSGTYKIELWGAGSTRITDNDETVFDPTTILSEEVFGAYTSGEIDLEKNELLYIYIGEQGERGTKKTSSSQQTNTNITFNGGGKGGTAGGPYTVSGKKAYYIHGSSGGGATDIRLVNGTYNNINSLRSRIMVASGASGTDNAGGLSGYTEHIVDEKYESNIGVKATQISGYQFGIAGNGEAAPSVACNGQAGGGGGYYGGGGAKESGGNCHIHSASSGSSYISGHTGCVAVTSASSTTPKSGCETGTTDNLCSVHYSNKFFENTLMIDGAGYNWTNVKGSLKQMPNPSGGFYESGKGHTGNGYARITLLDLT